MCASLAPRILTDCNCLYNMLFLYLHISALSLGLKISPHPHTYLCLLLLKPFLISQAAITTLSPLPCTSLYACVCAKSFQCLTLCNPMYCSPPGSSVHGILQARILEWVAMPCSSGSSQSRDRTLVSFGSCISGRFFITERPGKPPFPIILSKWSMSQIPGLYLSKTFKKSFCWSRVALQCCISFCCTAK